MSPPTLLPLYIVYDREDTLPNAGRFRTHLCRLVEEVSTAIGDPAALSLQLFEAGRTLPQTSSLEILRQSLDSPVAYRAELGAVLRGIAGSLACQCQYQPEVLLFLGTLPSDDSFAAWETLVRQHGALILTYWFQRPDLGADEQRRLLELLERTGGVAANAGRQPLYRIIAPMEARPDLLEEIFAKLRDRIIQRRLATGSIVLGSAIDQEIFGYEEIMTANPDYPVLAPQWESREPLPELGDPRPHLHCEERLTTHGWSLIGASVRGKLHAHEGTYRDDSFAFDYVSGWNLVAVADGAGSHQLSRVGSEVAVKAACGEMARRLADAPPESAQAVQAAQEALVAAWREIDHTAKERGRAFEDFGTTLLLLAHHLESHLLAVAQVGDGLLAVQLEGGDIRLLGSPETGEYSGQTSFLTNHQPAEFASRATAVQLDRRPILFLVMTDGVADDLYPPDQKLGGLIKPLPEVMRQEDRARALSDLINYDLPGSFDDRTLVVICRPHELSGEGVVADQAEGAPPASNGTVQQESHES